MVFADFGGKTVVLGVEKTVFLTAGCTCRCTDSKFA
jgi:hypothetical protein